MKRVASSLHLTSHMKAIWPDFLPIPAVFEIIGHEEH